MLGIIRTFLYCVFGVFSLVLFGLAAARLRYTTHLPPGDPLNDGHNFYGELRLQSLQEQGNNRGSDPIVAELLFSSLLGMGWSVYAVLTIHHMREDRLIASFAGEILVLSILFLLYLVGAAIATSIWGDLSFCHQFQACRILTALLAFAWLPWIVLMGLLVASVFVAIANAAFFAPFHGRWNPRESTYSSRRTSRA
ncbi:hypothetical protein MIND_00218800 [Mycena indigotica]|uniref:MARVEL domain-containing protein n=1 Tax=Mycena indigotica TaxID=2126181 RepID=A0A8H6T6Y3_9AGAR|nr:uncharacterized protein MIND_00218800 [Mycena indigotica]KAF7312066.1 hypothetical protein MIND_00218800 [Mycena indigotica]